MLVESKHYWNLSPDILISLVQDWAPGSTFLLTILGDFDIGVLGL